MSIQSALQCIQKLRREDALKAQLFALTHSPRLEDVCKLGTQQGLAFTVEDLKQAHKHDWALRWLTDATNCKQGAS